MFQVTTATQKILGLNKRIRAVCGGTAASKTISILLYLINKAQSEPNLLISVVSESFPHLKRGAMRDFLNILKEHQYFREAQWNKTDFIYTFRNKSIIEFFSVDQPAKVRGPRRQILFINEANNIPYEAFDQLEIRTTEEIWLDWNPTNEFWFYTEIQGRREDVDFITLTYKDNEALDKSIIDSIESHRLNKNWWQVYGLGQLGDMEGKIYTDWKIIDEVPHEARLERYGLDFGYTNDPAVIVAIYFFNGGYILDEITFQKGLSNKQIADIFNNIPKALVKADSAEPKSIDELKLYGINVMGVEKGADSVRQGIQYVQAQRISVTKRSLNIIKEYRNYMWKTDKDGNIINEPDHLYSHSMDAVRYGLETLRDTTAKDKQVKNILAQIQTRGEHW